jgi:hypothetical protein
VPKRWFGIGIAPCRWIARLINRSDIMNEKQQTPPHDSKAGVDERKQGPTSIQGAEARELEDGGRGSVETDAGKESKRKTPDRTGGVPESGKDVGLRGTPDIAEAAKSGNRGRN